jgi:hypothetical protein
MLALDHQPGSSENPEQSFSPKKVPPKKSRGVAPLLHPTAARVAAGILRYGLNTSQQIADKIQAVDPIRVAAAERW